MFTFLSKKLVISQNADVHSMSWHSMTDQLAIGGDNGMLKILKVEDAHDPQNEQQQAQPKISVDSIDSKHLGAIGTLNWNETYRKLTSVDNKGRMVIWTQKSGQEPGKKEWVQEMVNETGQYQITAVVWSKDETKLAILIEDGQIIVGSVDGEKLWSKTIDKAPMIAEWSPDGKYLIVGTKFGEVMVWESVGNYLFSMKIMCLQGVEEIDQREDSDHVVVPDVPLAAIEWYRGSKMNTDDTPAGLVIAYQNGRVQLVKNEGDINPILLDCSITVSQVRWNPNGTVFAVSGTLENNTEQVGVI